MVGQQLILTPMADLILTASFASALPSSTPRVVYDNTLCLAFRWKMPGLPRVTWRRGDMFLLVCGVLGTHWPFFTWKARGINDKSSSIQKLVDGFALVAWTFAIAIKPNIDAAEHNMRCLAYSTVEDDQERFTQLTSFRRDVARLYDNLKRSHMLVEQYLEASESRIAHREDMCPSESRTQRLAEAEREYLKRPLRSHLAKLEAQLDAVKEDLNDEIQVAISTVQGRDAQIMKEQARVMARQATWTVALLSLIHI